MRDLKSYHLVEVVEEDVDTDDPVLLLTADEVREMIWHDHELKDDPPHSIVDEARYWIKKDFSWEFVYEQMREILNYRMGDKIEKLKGCNAVPPWKEEA